MLVSIVSILQAHIPMFIFCIFVDHCTGSHSPNTLRKCKLFLKDEVISGTLRLQFEINQTILSPCVSISLTVPHLFPTSLGVRIVLTKLPHVVVRHILRSNN